jgi:DNA-binding transcriptional MerR regulator/methylmalonyl-CoA mutase cobalamin-binding subunit
MADRRRAPPSDPTYALGAVARIVGISEHVLRAWERRHRAVVPLRTAGGTRRYRASDVARLRKLHAATRAGHAIGQIARCSDVELDALVAEASPGGPAPPLAPLLAAIARLDAVETERLLSAQLAGLGAGRFIETLASPLLVEIGRRWEAGDLSVSAEHLASSVLRNLLGALLRPTRAALGTPPIVFTTPPGESHEIGALMAAVAAVEAGGNAVFLGPNLPLDEVVRSARALRAGAVALGVCDASARGMAGEIRALRARMPDRCALWVGGAASAGLVLPAGVARVADLGALERRVRLLAERPASPPA